MSSATLTTSDTLDRDHLPADSALMSDDLKRAIDDAAKLLPVQGPITVLVALNTLQALESQPYDEAVLEGSRLFGGEPYLPEASYRAAMDRDRIRPSDLEAALRHDLRDRADQKILDLCTRLELRLGMLRHPLRQAPTAELRWFVAETDALSSYREDAEPAIRSRFLDDTKHWAMREILPRLKAPPPHETGRQSHLRLGFANLFIHYGVDRVEGWPPKTWEAFALQALWRVSRDGLHGLKPAPASPLTKHSVRLRDWLFDETGQDSDRLVHEVLIRYCAAFLDQGLSPWPLPNRSAGFLHSFCDLYSLPGGPPSAWLRGLSTELKRIRDAGLTPLESIAESLQMLSVPAGEWAEYVKSSILALRGWAGMIYQVETRPDRAAVAIPEGTLVEYLAVRLILERFALPWIAHEALDFHGPLKELRGFLRKRHHETADDVEQRAFLIFQLAQLFGWSPAALLRLTKPEWQLLVEEVEGFSGLERRRVFHEAYERRHRVQALDALSNFTPDPDSEPEKPRFQAVFCIDDREESFRRHLEEIAPDVETFGMAGFFNVAMYYRGAADAHFVPLCPIVVRPQHYVTEYVPFAFRQEHTRRARTRKALGAASHQLVLGSRSFAGGALLTAGLGVLASIPLVTRVLSPRLYSLLWRQAERLVQPPQVTHLKIERTDPQPSPEPSGQGFSLDEMTNICERFLRDIGLTKRFSRLVLVIGHGSDSVNNPHKSVYDCGACGGAGGGPNARALSIMMNDLRVRDQLWKRGIALPRETVFVGGIHDTCNDSVTFFDLDSLPASHHGDFEGALKTLDETCDRNAHERCRRFWSAPLNISRKAARKHVEGRAEDLAQTRPEYGHSTNSLCIVGRRSRTRGLFLDRRSFFVSYDPTQDDSDYSTLLRLMTPAVPVCSGINLQYTFSRMDSYGWGSGTKLPHNVSGLLGVMDGAASDLRPGLPWQGVEIHEPMRLLFVVETTPKGMLRVFERSEAIAMMFRNRWVQLALLDPESSLIYDYVHGRFEEYRPESRELPTAPTSIDWYRGWRENLGFAAIRGHGV